jgi:hypothetical protein
MGASQGLSEVERNCAGVVTREIIRQFGRHNLIARKVFGRRPEWSEPGLILARVAGYSGGARLPEPAGIFVCECPAAFWRGAIGCR